MPHLPHVFLGLLIAPLQSIGLENDAQAFILLLCLMAIAYYGVAIYAAIAFFSQPVLVNQDFHPAISILKPICGLDSNTYENLASFCRQEYPQYQVIFGVRDANDPSVAVVQQLIDDFAAVDIQLVVSDRTIGANLKVSNLANASSRANYDILLLADSDIWVGPDYLQHVIQPLQNPAVGVVTCMYRSVTQSWLAALEALSVSTEFLPSVLVARQMEGMTFALGATIVIRKSVLAAIGGFAAVANYLGDDFKLGNLPAQAGYDVVLSPYVVDHVTTTDRVAAFIQHQTRWLRGNRFARPFGYAGLLLTYGTVISLLFLFLVGGAPCGWMVLGITWSIRVVMAWVVGVNYLKDSVARQWIWCVLLRDWISFALWCYSFTGNTVEWRGRQFSLSQGGQCIETSADLRSPQALG
jgi:ceramide glucosyltransferase